MIYLAIAGLYLPEKREWRIEIYGLWAIRPVLALQVHFQWKIKQISASREIGPS